MVATALCLLSAGVARLATWAACRAHPRSLIELERFNERAELSLAAAGAGTFVAYPRKNVMHCSRALLQLLGLPSEQGAIMVMRRRVTFGCWKAAFRAFRSSR
jgi:hypothetical protein